MKLLGHADPEMTMRMSTSRRMICSASTI
jgi:hypothetical protein